MPATAARVARKAWTPALLPGVVAWFVADDIAGADGSAVSSWKDRIKGTTVVQATGANQPVLKIAGNGINNRNAVSFTAASSQSLSVALSGTGVPAQAPFSVFLVGTKNNSTQARAISVGKAGANFGYGVGQQNQIQITTYGVADIGSAYGFTSAGDIAYAQHNGTRGDFTSRNRYPLLGITGGNANAGADTFSIGGRPTLPGQFWDGKIAEVIICSQVTSTANRNLTAQYLWRKYGILIASPYNAASATTLAYSTYTTCVENSVLYFPSGWNGKNYWLGYVAYEGSPLVAAENPAIMCSTDGNTWTEPAGITNPVVAYPGGGNAGNNSDPSLFDNTARDSKVYLFYQRENTFPTSTGGIWVTSSSDGVTWAAPTHVINATANNADFEPKVYYDTASGQYWMWTIDGTTGLLYRRTSSSVASGYSARTLCSWNSVPPLFTSAWHMGDVRLIGGKLVSAVSDAQGTRYNWLISSLDGLAWRLADHPIMGESGGGWDNGSIYRVCVMDAGDGLNLNAWYSTIGGTATAMSQKTTIPLAEIP